jgi:hypothetical protein
MFSSNDIGLYLDGLDHRVIKDKAGEEMKGVDLTMRIEPLTAELASEIAVEVRRTLFRLDDVEVVKHLKNATFTKLGIRPHSVEFRPDAKAPVSLLLDEVKFDAFKARIPKDGAHWVFTFRMTAAHLDGQQLLWLQEGLLKMHYCSFAIATDGLFDDQEQEARLGAAAPGPHQPDFDDDADEEPQPTEDVEPTRHISRRGRRRPPRPRPTDVPVRGTTATEGER